MNCGERTWRASGTMRRTRSGGRISPPRSGILLAGLDKQYNRGMLRMCENIITMELIRRRFKPREISEVTSLPGHCRLRLRTGELYNARLSKQHTLLLEAVDPVC